MMIVQNVYYNNEGMFRYPKTVQLLNPFSCSDQLPNVWPLYLHTKPCLMKYYSRPNIMCFPET
jgi:hypothetical protein